MKLKLTLLSILLGCVSSVYATIINLTPGGFNWNNEPQVVTDWYTNVRSSVLLWYPAKDFFTVTGFGTPTLTLSWNFAQPATFQWLFINSNNGPSNFYEIRGQQSHFGEGTFTIDGITPIDATGELISLVPFGHPPFETPDAGTTLMLFLLA